MMFGKRKRAKASAGDAVRQRLLRLEVSEMPAIERESAKSIYFALQRSPGGDPARIIVDTFLATLLVSESSDDTDVSASVRLFRSEFISNGRRWAESPRSDWNQLVDDMLQITKARATQSNDPQTRAVLCATYLFALIAYDPSKQAPTVEDVFEGAAEAVDATVPRVKTVVDATSGPGPTLLAELSTAMGIDDWTEKIRGGFRWTHGQLSTRFTSTLVDVKPGLPVWEVSVKTPIVENATAGDVPLLISELNEGAGGDALTYESSDGTISSVMTIVVHRENDTWVTPLAKMLVMAAVDLADSRADLLTAATEGRVSLGSHRSLGVRSDRDPILGIVGSKNWPTAAPPGDVDFWSTLLSELRGITHGVGTSSASGLSIEIDGLGDDGRGTTLLTIGSEDGVFWHEQSAASRMGPGVTFRCGLQREVNNSAEVANQLNLDEPGSRPSRLGAWYARDDGIWLALRIPGAALPRDRDDARAVALNLAIGFLARARAAQDWLHTQD